MATPPDSLRAYIELHRSSHRRFAPPQTIASFEAVLKGWHDHRHFVGPPDYDSDADIFFKHFTDYVQMKTGIYSLRYWGFIIDGQAGGADAPITPPKPDHTSTDVLERAHVLFFELYDSFWADHAAGKPLRGTSPPEGRY